MKTATHNFNLESNKSKNGDKLIYFNFNYGYSEYNATSDRMQYIPMRISTQQRIQPQYWDVITYRTVKKYVSQFGADLNNQLDRIQKISYQALTAYREEHEQNPSPQQLKDIIEVKLGRKEKMVKDITIVNFIDGKIKEFQKLPITARKHVTDGTIKNYSVFLNLLKKYESIAKLALTFKNLDEKKYWSFFTVVNNDKKKEDLNGYTVNYMAKLSNIFLMFLRLASEANINVSLNIHKDGLNIEEMKSANEIFYTEERLTKILNADVAHSSEFNNARNFIILSALTGLRYGDLYELHSLQTEQFNGRSVSFTGIISKVRKVSKVNREVKVCIPILEPVNRILSENGWRFPTFPKGQPLNRQLKKLCKHLEFEEVVKLETWYYGNDTPTVTYQPFHELVHSHTGRKSFYTNLIQHGISNQVIDNITHPSVRKKEMKDVYNNSTIIDNAEMFRNAVAGVQSDVYKVVQPPVYMVAI
ncbi:MAG: hypothetical protein JWN78_3107 [Bacteroidota bacterium]|nr:hypothetical protein [Bacteroidota bacterium]